MIDYNNIKNNSVVLLLSGGVDSSVALHELCSHGIRPDCYYIQIGPKEEKGYDCNSDEDIEMATWVARKYNCNFNIVDLHDEYWTYVTGYTMDKVKNGLTPNPDVMCNMLIKFGAFYDKIGKNYDYIATGHYAQTYIDLNGNTWLQTSPDPVKDQTDFLCNISQLNIEHALFPIGHMHKDEVRKIAEEQNLINKKRKDSQGICFLGKINYNEYIEKFLGKKPGYIREYETNNILGSHNGHWFHTIGQRKGLGLSGGPWYVVKKDISDNVVYVSRDKLIMNQSTNIIKLNGLHMLTKDEGINMKIHNGEAIDIAFKFRHTPEINYGILVFDKDSNSFVVKTKNTLHGVAPGQFCIIYDKNFNLVYCSAEIKL